LLNVRTALNGVNDVARLPSYRSNPWSVVGIQQRRNLTLG
jgi:hypothetical protein